MKSFVLVLLLLASAKAKPSRTDSSDYFCPEGFSFLDYQCFLPIMDTQKSWNDSRDFCKARGGDLASPNSVLRLQSLLLPLVGADQKLWVSASDIKKEGDWIWASGKPVSEEDWSAFQPNNCCGGEDCALLGTSWFPPLNDNSCRNRRNFVCEVPISG